MTRHWRKALPRGGHGQAGRASAETVFEYHQNGDLIWATYQGGAVRLGFLVGTRDGDTLDFRYSQLNEWGTRERPLLGRRSPCCPTAGSA